MNWSVESRQSLVRSLEPVERVTVAIYRLLLAVIAIVLLAVAGYVAVHRPLGAGHQGEYFYFGVAVLLGLGWTLGQLASLQARKARAFPAATWQPGLEAGSSDWQLQLGGPLVETRENGEGGQTFVFSRKIVLPMQSLTTTSLPTELLPDEAMLAALQREVEGGVSIEQACARLQPQFAAWDGQQQQAYCLLVKCLLEHRTANQASPLDGLTRTRRYS